MSLPTPSEIADGHALEDVYLYVEDDAGDTRAVGHEMRTTLPEILQEHDLEGTTLRIATAEPGKMTTRTIELDHARSGQEQETHASEGGQAHVESDTTPEATAVAQKRVAQQTTSLVQTETERILSENERLRTRLAKIRTQYESRMDALQERYQERVDGLRKEVEEAREEAHRAKEDMGAWERVALHAGPKLPGLLGAVTKRLSTPEHNQTRYSAQRTQLNQEPNRRPKAIPEGDNQQSANERVGEHDEGQQKQTSHNDHERASTQQKSQEIDQKDEVLRMEIVQSALGVLNGPVTVEQFKDGLEEAVEKGIIDEAAIPHSIERVAWFVRFVDENLGDYIGVLQSVGPEEAAAMLAAAADFEVTPEGERMIAALLEHAEA